MTTVIDTRATPAAALQRIQATIDLTWVRRKLADPEEGKGFTPREINLMESEYRKFLALHLAFPDMDLVPCKLVDEIWHQHILDTAAYREDCLAVFAKFLDHFPYFGMRDDEDARALEGAYRETLQRYREAFGDPPPETWLARDGQSCKRTACKPQKCK